MVVREEQRHSLNEWQRISENEPRGRWITWLIGKIGHWLDRKEVVVPHGGYQLYLCKIGKVPSPDCVRCHKVFDNLDHTFFSCRRQYKLCQLCQLYADTEKFLRRTLSLTNWAGLHVRFFPQEYWARYKEGGPNGSSSVNESLKTQIYCSVDYLIVFYILRNSECCLTTKDSEHRFTVMKTKMLSWITDLTHSK